MNKNYKMPQFQNKDVLILSSMCLSSMCIELSNKNNKNTLIIVYLVTEKSAKLKEIPKTNA